MEDKHGFNCPLLSVGSSGREVAFLQRRLTGIGFGLGAIDGIFGNKTLQALISFQRSAGLEPTGTVTVRTWQALGVSCIPPTVTPSPPPTITPTPTPTPTPTVTPTPTPTPTPTVTPTPIPTAPPCASEIFWLVEEGDNIYQIARESGTTVSTLLRLNPHLNPNNLRPGDRICLP